jgi:positive regulator of sigma E activity
MKTRGTVVRRAGGTTWVRVCHGEHCAGCGMHSPDDAFVEVEVGDSIGTQVGDKVELDSDAARMIRTVFLVFWLPLISAGLLAWGGWELSAGLQLAPELGAAVLAAVGFACAIAVVRGVEKRTEAGAGLTIVRVVSEDALPCRASSETGDARVG